MHRRSSRRRSLCLVTLLLGVNALVVPVARAGFINVTTLTDTPFTFYGFVDHVPPPAGVGAVAGGLVNWERNVNENLLPGPTLAILLAGRHNIFMGGPIAPDPGDVNPNPNLLGPELIGPLFPGGAAIGPILRGPFPHPGVGHVNWLQFLYRPTGPATSRLLIRFDHTKSADDRPPKIPEPSTMWLVGIGTLAVLARGCTRRYLGASGRRT